MCERRGLVTLTAIAIRVSPVDLCGRCIRLVKTMTSTLPDWRLVPRIWWVYRGEEVGFMRGICEEVPSLQIGNGMTSFSVTVSRGGVIVIDIGWGGASPGFGATGNSK